MGTSGPHRHVSAVAVAIAIAIAGAVAAVAGAPGATAAESPVRIVTPRAGLVTSTEMRVVVRTAPGLRTFTARLRGRDVSRHFHRVGPGLWQATLTRPRVLRPGPAELAVLTRDSRGREGVETVRLTIGRAHPGYVRSVSSARRFTPGSFVRVTVGSRPTHFEARLNGLDVTHVFPHFGRERAARLSADDGLRFGVNRLVVVAARKDGTYGRVSRTLRVPRSRPLVAAGNDQLTMSGQRVRLSAHRTRPARGGTLSYSWTLTRRPPGSKATIRRADSRVATLTPDVPGRFVTRVTVTERPPAGARPRAGAPGPRRAVDEATIGNQPSFAPIGAPINTIAILPNGEPAVTIGTGPSDPNWAFYPTRGVVEQLVFDRQLLSLEARNFFDGPNAAAQALNDLKQRDSSQLVVLTTGGVSNPAAIGGDWPKVWAQLGATPSDDLSNGNWSVIGVPGAADGGASNSDGGMTGYLQFDATGDYPSYTFVAGQYANYSTSIASTSSSNTMQVNGQSYPSEALSCPGGGGLQVVAVSSRTLAPAFNSTYATNCGDATANAGALANLHAQLTALPSAAGGPHVLLVQSIGTPFPANATDAWYQVGLDLDELGGTAGVFNTATGAYALVGGDGLTEPGSIASRGPETSRSLTNSGGTLTGVLRRNGQYHYEVILGTPGGDFTQTLTSIVYPQQPLQPWAPTDSPAQRSIVSYITAKVLGIPQIPNAGAGCYVPAQPDIRAWYCDITTYTSANWTNMSEKVGALINTPPPAGTGFAQDDWNNVTTELSNEMAAVPSVYKLVSQLQQVYGTSEVQAAVQVNEVFATVSDALTPPPAAQPEGTDYWTTFAGEVLDIGELLGGEDLIAGLLANGVHLVADSMTDSDGTPVLNSPTLGVPAAQLGSEIASRYQRMSDELGHLADMIVTDGGKLRAFTQSPNVGANSTALTELEQSLKLSAKRVAWGKMLSAAYRLDMLHQEANNNPPWCPVASPVAQCDPPASGFLCSLENYQWFPFQNAPADAQFVVPTPVAPGTTDRGRLFVVADPTVNGGWYPNQTPWMNPNTIVSTPSASLLAPLFQPLSAKGLGLYKQWFYARNFNTDVELPAAAKTGAQPYYFSCQG